MESLTIQMNKILEEYVDEARDAINEAAESVAKQTVQKLKATSPKKRIKGGTYASGWTLKTLSVGASSTAITVYNSKAPGLTHLLENGHASYNQHGGSYRYVSGRPHIKPVEEWANQEFENECRRRLE